MRLAVRDFLLFHFNGWDWPVFNFADVFLVTGATMLALQSPRPLTPRELEETGGRSLNRRRSDGRRSAGRSADRRLKAHRAERLEFAPGHPALRLLIAS